MSITQHMHRLQKQIETGVGCRWQEQGKKRRVERRIKEGKTSYETARQNSGIYTEAKSPLVLCRHFVSACKLDPTCTHFWVNDALTSLSFWGLSTSKYVYAHVYVHIHTFIWDPWTDDLKESLRNKQLISWHMVSLLLLFQSRSLPLLPQDATYTHTITDLISRPIVDRQSTNQT